MNDDPEPSCCCCPIGEGDFLDQHVVSDPHWTSARLIVWVFISNGDFAVALLLHGFDCGMIRLWATVTTHR
jgi:hypothetical protein